MKRLAVATLGCVILFSCTRPEPPAINKFSDAVLVKIADFQDRRLSDSLYRYFKSENAVYRRDAVLAFASIQDTAAVEKIGELLLNDSGKEVRLVAAFALGQTAGDKSSAVLGEAASKEKDLAVRKEILEAYAKAVDTNKVNTAVFDAATDSLTAAGVAWSYYRLGLKGFADTTQIRVASNYLAKGTTPGYGFQTRLGASHFFARGSTPVNLAEAVLLSSSREDASAEVRMASAFALRKVTKTIPVKALQEIIEKDGDYRVRTNAIRALQSFPFEQTRDILIKALQDQNVNAAVAASEGIKSYDVKNSWKELASLAKETKNGRIQANLYEAALKASQHKELAEEIAQAVERTADPYHKAALLTALQQSVMSFGFIEEQLFKADTPVVRSSAAAALVAINHLPSFPSSLKKRFSDLYTRAVKAGDPGVIGLVAGALADSTLGYKEEIRDIDFLYQVKTKLVLARDIEALQSLETAIAWFEEKKNYPPVENEFNHPVDWGLVRTIPKDQKAVIKTSKGEIVIRLFVEEAPGSVANFAALADKHYFDQKFFHRVVPNFVVQAGCNRGDGYGSEEYSIRSEFSPRRYKAGSVGMASAGKDTEGTQWFITHSPTPHLDGRYTIFAEVESGMDVVHKIEVGDKILEVKLVR